MSNKSEKPFTINDPLLLQAIVGQSACKFAPLKESTGYLYYDKDFIGRAYLEYCYSRIFEVHRFPGYENFYIRNADTCRKMIMSGEISERDIDASIKQLKELYDYTQDYLGNRGLETLTLYRWLRNPEIYTAVQHDTHIDFLSNTLISFSYSSDHNYGTGLQIKKTVQRKDVLMLDYLTEYNSCICDKRVFTGEDEVWILNKDKFGCLHADIERKADGLTLKSERETIYNQIRRISDTTDCGIKDTIINYPRPCDIGFLTKKLIQRNKNKIERKYY